MDCRYWDQSCSCRTLHVEQKLTTVLYACCSSTLILSHITFNCDLVRDWWSGVRPHGIVTRLSTVWQVSGRSAVPLVTCERVLYPLFGTVPDTSLLLGLQWLISVRRWDGPSTPQRALSLGPDTSDGCAIDVAMGESKMSQNWQVDSPCRAKPRPGFASKKVGSSGSSANNVPALVSGCDGCRRQRCALDCAGPCGYDY